MASSVGASDGSDNVVELRGISHQDDAVPGGRWVSFDYIQLDATPVPEPGGIAFALLGTCAFAFRRRR